MKTKWGGGAIRVADLGDAATLEARVDRVLATTAPCAKVWAWRRSTAPRLWQS